MNNFFLTLLLFLRFIEEKYIYHTAKGLLIISIGLMVAIFYFGSKRAGFRKKKKKFKEWIEPFISTSILLSTDDIKQNLQLALSSQQPFLKNRYGRQVMINELLVARKNLSGSAAENIQTLYEQLALDKDSEKKLTRYKWHHKAKGIQELSIMYQHKHWQKIFQLTNHRNKYVRMEAQAGIVRMLRFEGLNFLNDTVYPISEWQQITLLKLISQFPSEELKGEEKWLESSNPSVIIFALKVVANFRRYKLHNKVKNCLDHPSHDVRLQAVKTLGEIYQEDTYQHIINAYAHNPILSFRLQALESLGKIGTEAATPFLLNQLHIETVALKMAATRALLKSSPNGIDLLQKQTQNDNTHWNLILAQLKYEMHI